MFDPGITEGDWSVNKRASVVSNLRRGICSTSGYNDNLWICSTSGYNDNGRQAIQVDLIDKENSENAKAIAAVPELLEVYKAAKGYLKANEDFIYRYTRGIETLPSADKTLMAMHLLRGAIIKLEERHAK